MFCCDLGSNSKTEVAAIMVTELGYSPEVALILTQKPPIDIQTSSNTTTTTTTSGKRKQPELDEKEDSNTDGDDLVLQGAMEEKDEEIEKEKNPDEKRKIWKETTVLVA